MSKPTALTTRPQTISAPTGPPTTSEFQQLIKMADSVARTNFVPASLRGKPDEILACVLTGRELGIGPMQSLRHIVIVNGRATLSAELMVAQIRKAGHSIEGACDPMKATVKGKRADTGDAMTVTWTMEMAKRAKLAAKDNWTMYPEAMLWARAVSQLARMLFADVLSGVSYTTAEALEMPDAPVDIEQAAPALPEGESDNGVTGEALTSEQKLHLTDLHNSLPDAKKWGVAKLRAEVDAGGYEGALAALTRAHAAACGVGCEHVRSQEPESSEPEEEYLPGVDEG